MKIQPKLTELEHVLNELLNDGCKHAYSEVRDIVMEFVGNDPEFTRKNVNATVARLREKLKRLEPQVVVANTMVGRRLYWRKYRKLSTV